ncbi:hypothetical protein KIN20_026849 [Parelaphostrongylus tenuis]|uniref:Uncharacterized protein n=1 Tax=Parelaphostrongylus tenuis TaxID=148309 RepID=A0AAD5QYU3_PARTN|nr:hypothetical protein KIN20_026849 [Parelaphostrongylus tenuis]
MVGISAINSTHLAIPETLSVITAHVPIQIHFIEEICINYKQRHGELVENDVVPWHRVHGDEHDQRGRFSRPA